MRRARNRTCNLFSGHFSEKPCWKFMHIQQTKFGDWDNSKKNISNDKFHIPRNSSNLIRPRSKMIQILDKMESFKKLKIPRLFYQISNKNKNI